MIWIVLSYLSLFILSLADNMRGPVFPDLLRDYGLNDTLGAMFFLVSSLAGTFTNISAGRWLKAWGPFKALRLFTVVQIVGLFVIGTARTYPILLLGSATLGIALGGLSVAQNVVLPVVTREAIRRQIFSGLHCMYGSASFVAPLLASLLYRYGWSWPYAFIFLGLLPLPLLIMMLVTKEVPAVEPVSPHHSKALSGVARRAALWFACILGLYVLAEVLISTRLVLYARRERLLKVEDANDLLSGFFILLFLVRLIFAVLPLRWSSRRVLLISGGLSVLANIAGFFGTPWGFVLCGLTMAPFFPYVMALIGELRPGDRDRITSWSLTASAIGLIFMNLILGKMTDTFGLWWAMWLGPFCLVVMMVLLIRGCPSEEKTFENRDIP